MLRNFFKTAIRNLAKNRFFTLLNVIGLALGMSISLLFVALLVFLSRYDDFHPHKERIHRVTTQVYDREENPHYASAPVGVAQKLRDDIAGVDKVVRIHRSLGGDAAYGEKKIPLGGYFADPEFFEVFNFPLVEGNKATALSRPNSLVITESEATKIFGSRCHGQNHPSGSVWGFRGYRHCERPTGKLTYAVWCHSLLCYLSGL